jgi:hypothetical protein
MNQTFFTIISQMHTPQTTHHRQFQMTSEKIVDVFGLTSMLCLHIFCVVSFYAIITLAE